jgi:hypothetical protein
MLPIRNLFIQPTILRNHSHVNQSDTTIEQIRLMIYDSKPSDRGCKCENGVQEKESAPIDHGQLTSKAEGTWEIGAKVDRGFELSS